ncbi:Putative endonuclease, type II restriction enzyme (fragment) (plasmid) [Cupriavidus taiwanensis]|uniref:Endonuclease, type II restriction enzyme n=2 Tax=Cupriavidus taiwanensis TaxID=164546 RepID=A0A7Z7NRV2_9BURK
MGRRRKEPSLSEILIDAPWWVSAALAVGAYIVLRGVVPAIFGSSPLLTGIAVLSQSLAWVPAAMFGFLGVLSYIRARRRERAGQQEIPVRARSSRTSRSSSRWKSSQSSGESMGSREDVGPPPRTAALAEKPEINSWTLDALQQLEWKRFELLCVGYYEAMGFTVKTVPHGPDGGIDATLYKAGRDGPVAVVQCKAWRKPVKVEQVRALAGVMG